mmetsp:Transcript_31600/g.92444  ORF Transcript_31600/g.92444 Transcript_31600/m.92444 type:complete len:228 (+) Transcript_31600:361-1044(+)
MQIQGGVGDQLPDAPGPGEQEVDMRHDEHVRVGLVCEEGRLDVVRPRVHPNLLLQLLHQRLRVVAEAVDPLGAAPVFLELAPVAHCELSWLQEDVDVGVRCAADVVDVRDVGVRALDAGRILLGNLKRPDLLQVKHVVVLARRLQRAQGQARRFGCPHIRRVHEGQEAFVHEGPEVRGAIHVGEVLVPHGERVAEGEVGIVLDVEGDGRLDRAQPRNRVVCEQDEGV